MVTINARHLMSSVPGTPPRTSLVAGSTSVRRITRRLRSQRRKLPPLGDQRAHLVLDMATTSARLLMSSVLGILPKTSLAAGSISVSLITRKLRLQQRKLLQPGGHRDHPDMATTNGSFRITKVVVSLANVSFRSHHTEAQIAAKEAAAGGSSSSSDSSDSSSRNCRNNKRYVESP